jgi:methylenetetrahydrofolate--tRNA-(uracil-5-)-methyltransferase
VCQLRRETASGESWGLVGFQTRLVQESQREVFRLIPGLEKAEFLRYGSIHRNSYMDSPRLLSGDLSFNKMPDVFLCGQLCGNEGYTESIATGHIAALSVISRIKNHKFTPPPPVTAFGALLRHVTNSPVKPFTPSGINFGLFDSLPDKIPKKMGKEMKQQKMCERGIKEMEEWKKSRDG